MVKFQSTLHQKLWRAMKNSWYLVKKFGLTDTKIHIRQSILNDPFPIFNSCYACEYDVQMAESKGEKHMCKYCPIYIERCNSVCSTLFQMSLAISDNDRHKYEQLCLEMANAPVKSGVEYE